MSRFKQWFPFGYRLYRKIAEPRVVRLIHFAIYAFLLVAGTGVLMSPPKSFQGVLGVTLVFLIGIFVSLGATFGLVSVLQGIWWLERAGVIALWSGIGLYVLAVLGLRASLVIVALPIVVILMLVLRWREIKRYQLAPIRKE